MTESVVYVGPILDGKIDKRMILKNKFSFEFFANFDEFGHDSSK